MAMTKPHYQAAQNQVNIVEGTYHINPRGLNIVWGNDERYWKIPKNDNDPSPAELVQVSWLEVTGSVDNLDPGKYKLTFEVKLTEDAFGWKDIQVFLMAKVGKKGRYKWQKVKLDPAGKHKDRALIPDDGLLIDVPATGDKNLHFGLYEVWSGKWKGGLQIYNAKVTRTTPESTQGTSN